MTPKDHVGCGIKHGGTSVRSAAAAHLSPEHKVHGGANGVRPRGAGGHHTEVGSFALVLDRHHSRRRVGDEGRDQERRHLSS